MTRTEITLDDLILLAEACGLKRVDTMPEVWAGSDVYLVDRGGKAIYIRDQHGRPAEQAWNPYTSFSDAGMLMRALGIDLILHMHGNTPYWEASGSWYLNESNVAGRGDGNTKAAQCEAICRAALQIVGAKG